MRKIIYLLLLLIGCASCAQKEINTIEDYNFKIKILPLEESLIEGQINTYLLEVEEYNNEAELILNYRVNNSTEHKIKIAGNTINDSYVIKDKKTTFTFTPPTAGDYSFSFTVKNIKTSVTATFEIKVATAQTFVVDIKASIGGSVTPSSKQQVKYNATCDISATAEKYYNFIGWSDGSLEAKRSITVISDTTITANFELKKDDNFNPKITLITPDNNFYTERKIELELVNYTKEKITLNYRVNEKTDEFISLNSENVPHNNFELNTKIDKKFTFSYKPSQVEKKSIEFILINDEFKKTLNLEIPISALTHVLFSTSEGGNISHVGGTYEYNSTVECVATPTDGYAFVGWYSNDELISSEFKISVTVGLDPASYTAKFRRLDYTISTTISPSDAGTIKGAGVYNYNDEYIVTATANQGYVFEKFIVNNEEYTINPLKGTVKTDLAIKAFFNKVKRTIIFTAGEGGSVSNTGGVYEYGAVIKSTAHAENGMRFIGWYFNNNLYSTSNEISFTVGLEDSTFEARFESNIRNVFISNETPLFGTVTGAGAYDYNAAVTITSTPVKHYHLAGIYENGVFISKDLNYSFKIQTDRHFTTSFEINRHTVKTISDTGYNISNTVTHNGGDNVTIRLTINQGYKFLGFKNDYTLTYDSVNEQIIINDISRDYTIEPNVRHNIIEIYLSEYAGNVLAISSKPAPCDLLVSIDAGSVQVTIPKNSTRGYSDFPYSEHVQIEYANGYDLQGYELKWN